jgi:hypothetical protein
MDLVPRYQKKVLWAVHPAPNARIANLLVSSTIDREA